MNGYDYDNYLRDLKAADDESREGEDAVQGLGQELLNTMLRSQHQPNSGELALELARAAFATLAGGDRRRCPHGCAGGHTEDEYYGGDCPHRDSEPFEGWGTSR